MQLNATMKSYMVAELTSKKVALPASLKKIFDSRFTEVYGCCVLESMIPSASSFLGQEQDRQLDKIPEAWEQQFPNRACLEHAVSEINIDDFVKSNFLARALCFLREIFTLFNSQYPDKVLRGIISIYSGPAPEFLFACQVSYHVKRDGESWLSDDVDTGGIEKYQEAVLIIDSNESYL